jgi:hypothetical protein
MKGGHTMTNIITDTSQYNSDLEHRVLNNKPDTYAIVCDRDRAMLRERGSQFNVVRLYFVSIENDWRRHELDYSIARNFSFPERKLLLIDRKGGSQREDVRYALFNVEETRQPNHASQSELLPITSGETARAAFLLVECFGQSDSAEPYFFTFKFSRTENGLQTALLKGRDESVRKYIGVPSIADEVTNADSKH